MTTQEQNKLAEESISRAIESVTDGIIVLYNDHLSMDAFKVFVRKGGKTLKFDTAYRYHWSDEQKRNVIDEAPIEEKRQTESMEVCMMTSSSYYGTVGLGTMLGILHEKYGLPVYYLNIGWCTFPRAYRDMSDYLKCIKEHVSFDVQLLNCDYTIVKTEG